MIKAPAITPNAAVRLADARLNVNLFLVKISFIHYDPIKDLRN
jgi:hypothetical protein